jgi:hypothetical protein
MLAPSPTATGRRSGRQVEGANARPTPHGHLPFTGGGDSPDHLSLTHEGRTTTVRARAWGGVSGSGG